MSAPVLTVDIGGESVPLTECTWVQTAPCGCNTGCVIASSGSRVYASPEAACLALNDGRKRRAERDQSQGFVMSLCKTTDIQTGAVALADCGHTPKWGVAS